MPAMKSNLCASGLTARDSATHGDMRQIGEARRQRRNSYHRRFPKRLDICGSGRSNCSGVQGSRIGGSSLFHMPRSAGGHMSLINIRPRVRSGL